MKRAVFYILFFCVIFANINADEPPIHITEIISQNNQFKLNLKNTINENNSFIENWELIKIDTNEVIYDFICNQFSLSGLKVFISDDGKNIALVNWFLYVNWRNENNQSIKNKTVIRFFFLGEEIKKYKLADVFGDINRGVRSVSHLQWTGYNHDRNSIIMENGHIIIKTLESFEYRFNVNNGDIINRRRI